MVIKVLAIGDVGSIIRTIQKYTKKLYNSIKAEKNSLTMQGYGGLHHEGYNTNAYKVPARPFIETTLSQDTEDKFFKDLEKNLKI